jgi:hypothetical protein
MEVPNQTLKNILMRLKTPDIARSLLSPIINEKSSCFTMVASPHTISLKFSYIELGHVFREANVDFDYVTDETCEKIWCSLCKYFLELNISPTKARFEVVRNDGVIIHIVINGD